MATVGAVEVGRGAGRGSRGGGADRGGENTTKERAWKDRAALIIIKRERARARQENGEWPSG